MLPNSKDIDDMSEKEFRHYVADSFSSMRTSQERIELAVVGVPGDVRNRGIVGAVEDLTKEVKYERTQRKTDILPRLQAHTNRMDEMKHNHDNHVTKETAWRNGLMWALGGVSTILGIVLAFNIT